MEKQGHEMVELFLQKYGQSEIRWEDNGRGKATKINGATILYAIHEQRLTFQGETEENCKQSKNTRSWKCRRSAYEEVSQKTRLQR